MTFKLSKSSCKSQILVDLGSRRTPGALQSLSMMKSRMGKIKSALVYSSCPAVDVHAKIMSCCKVSAADVVSIFQVLGNMPNLREVSVDLDMQWGSLGGLPLAALVALLSRAKKLSCLQLIQLDVSFGSRDEWKDLAKALRKHKNLSEITVLNCNSGKISTLVGLLAKHCQNLQTFRISGSSIDSKALARLSSYEHHPNLRSLHLEALNDLHDNDIHTLCLNLQDPHFPLAELTISSSTLTESAGNRLVDMLCLNTSITRLVLHLDCELPSIAECFLVNSTLRDVNLRLYGDDDSVADTVQQIAAAMLYSPIQKLRLRMEIEPWEYQQSILHAFRQMMALDINTSLQQLTIDDGVELYPLTQDLKLHLELNRCGYTRFIRNTNRVSPYQWMQVLESAGQLPDLSVLYTVLRNCPCLTCAPISFHDTPKDIDTPNNTRKWLRYGLTRTGTAFFPKLPTLPSRTATAKSFKMKSFLPLAA